MHRYRLPQNARGRKCYSIRTTRQQAMSSNFSSLCCLDDEICAFDICKAAIVTAIFGFVHICHSDPTKWLLWIKDGGRILGICLHRLISRIRETKQQPEKRKEGVIGPSLRMSSKLYRSDRLTNKYKHMLQLTNLNTLFISKWIRNC